MHRRHRRWFRRLVFAGNFEGLFLFNSNVAKFCGIKYFSAFLALNKFSVFLAGDDLDDGMFALSCHLGEELANGMDFAPLRRACQLGIVQGFRLEIRGGFVVDSW
jgi:hypothetical protein